MPACRPSPTPERALVAAARAAGAAVEVVPGPVGGDRRHGAGGRRGGRLRVRRLPAVASGVGAPRGAASGCWRPRRRLGLPLILYEAPHRVAAPARRAGGAGARMLAWRSGASSPSVTSRCWSGHAAEVARARLAQPRGEFTLVISGLEAPAAADGAAWAPSSTAGRRAGLPDGPWSSCCARSASRGATPIAGVSRR